MLTAAFVGFVVGTILGCVYMYQMEKSLREILQKDYEDMVELVNRSHETNETLVQTCEEWKNLYHESQERADHWASRAREQMQTCENQKIMIEGMERRWLAAVEKQSEGEVN